LSFLFIFSLTIQFPSCQGLSDDDKVGLIPVYRYQWTFIPFNSFDSRYHTWPTMRSENQVSEAAPKRPLSGCPQTSNLHRLKFAVGLGANSGIEV
jgi:hypothetical protein